MNLRRQLLVVCLVLLALPWAGCQFVREMEEALRSGQSRALAASARAVAASLHNQPELLAIDSNEVTPTGASPHSLYAPPGPPVIVDGYSDDWTGAALITLVDDAGFTVRYALRANESRLFMLLVVDDSTPTFTDPARNGAVNGDRVLLRFGATGDREALVATAAPGKVRGRPRLSSMSLVDARRIRGSWQDSQAGYTVELDLPLSLMGNRFAFQVVDADPSGDRQTSATLPVWRGTYAPRLMRQSTALSRQLARFADTGMKLQVIDSQYYLAGNAEGEPAGNVDSKQSTFWALRILYRAILRERRLPSSPRVDNGRLSSDDTAAALSGTEASQWYDNNEGEALIAAAAPIFNGEQVIAAVRIEQDSEQYLALADAAVGRVLAATLSVLVLAVITLLGYASLLSLRITRLKQATAKVINARGAVASNFPRSSVPDEIGDLSRHFADLLKEIAGYNDYLRNLARQLSHELRTPIAVIQSSLDNLEDSDVSEEQRNTYIQRSRNGLERLSRILSAMSEASRLEDSIASSTAEPVLLPALLRDICAAYQDTYIEHQIALDIEERAASATAFAPPELLVQALDKLVDNAVSFAPAGSVIRLSLTAANGGWAISVSNEGPTLPDDVSTRLFEPMVSLRSERGATPHLGLGLHIVSLIATHCGGEIEGRSQQNPRGAVFTLLLPAANDEASA